MTEEMEMLRDKKDWGEGPWLTEPDRLEWRYRGMPCLIVRADVTGSLCGYAGVGPDHPWYGKGYNDCVKGCKTVAQKPLEPFGEHAVPETIQRRHMASRRWECDDDYSAGHRVGSVIDVHGGLTYTDFCDEGGKICHVPLQGEPDKVWWFGFDCAHCDDLSPRMEATLNQVIPGRNQTVTFSSFQHYRDMEYVTKEVQLLADQLIDVKEASDGNASMG